MKGRSIAEVSAGAVVVAVAAAFLFFAVTHSGRGTTAAEGTRLTARFDRIDGLSNGADVRLAGVKIGMVTETRIDPQNFNAEVVMRIDRALRLPTDSSAEVASEGLLGGKYIALVPGGSDTVLVDGGRITETQGSVSLESLLGRFIFSVTQMNAQQPAGGETPPAATPR